MAKFVSLVKANKNHVMNSISPFTKRFTAAPYSHLKPIPIMRFSSSSTCIISPPDPNTNATCTSIISPPDPNTNATCTKNPCFDLFFKSRVEIYNPTNAEACRQLIEKMLPVAWSHNPLTTLKLICRILLDKSNGKYYSDQTFHTVTFWLHQNHPKTLACNVSSIAQLFVSFFQFFNLMGLCLVMKEENRFNGKGIHCRDNNARGQAEADVVEPDFGFLHELVSDLFAECLKSDMEKLKHYSNVDDADTDHDEYMMMGITEAAACCLSIGSCFSDPNTMCKSIARKVFPRESYPEYQGVEEVDYADRVLNRLRNEVLVPLSKACSSASSTCNRGNSREFVVDEYFEEVKAENSKIAADALFPYEITAYAYECSFEQVAELQWKTLVANMMSRISNKQGNKIFNNCLPICDVNSLHILGRRSVEVSVALALLVSELNEEPWKGKVIDCSTLPNLHLVQGDGLRHKCDFVRRMDSGWSIDFVKVFDLILKEAVNAELKPEEMIKKVLVFTSTTDFDSISADWMNFDDPSWKNEYEAVQRNFKEKGYGNAVPEIVLWNMSEWEQRKWVLPSTHPGVTALDGFTNNLIKLLLDNGGGIRPDLVMEASIAGQEFQRMVVMD